MSRENPRETISRIGLSHTEQIVPLRRSKKFRIASRNNGEPVGLLRWGIRMSDFAASCQQQVIF